MGIFSHFHNGSRQRLVREEQREASQRIIPIIALYAARGQFAPSPSVPPRGILSPNITCVYRTTPRIAHVHTSTPFLIESPLHHSSAETRHMTAFTTGMRPQINPARASRRRRTAAGLSSSGV